MMRGNGMVIRIAAALAALSAPIGSKAERAQLGKATLDELFTARFSLAGGHISHQKSGKHRKSGTVPEAGPKHHTTYWRGAPGHKEAARRLARGERGDDSNWQQRKAWLERNQHVIAKREADQERARGPKGGRNAIIWGRP